MRTIKGFRDQLENASTAKRTMSHATLFGNANFLCKDIIIKDACVLLVLLDGFVPNCLWCQNCGG